MKPVYTLAIGLLLTVAVLYFSSQRTQTPTETSGVAGIFTPLSCM